MFSPCRIGFFTRRVSSLKLQPLLETATTIQTKIRQGLPMADELDLRVLRLGYDEKIVEKFFQQQQTHSKDESRIITMLKTENFISYHQDLFVTASKNDGDDGNNNNNDSSNHSDPVTISRSSSTPSLKNDHIFRLINESHARGSRGSACAGIVRLPFSERMLRPGGSSSGPTMMTLADAAMFAVSYALCGKPLAVTTNFQINFFRKPMAGQELVAEARLLKGGKRLQVFEVDVMAVDKDVFSDEKVFWNENDDEEKIILVSHATGTYSIPH